MGFACLLRVFMYFLNELYFLMLSRFIIINFHNEQGQILQLKMDLIKNTMTTKHKLSNDIYFLC